MRHPARKEQDHRRRSHICRCIFRTLKVKKIAAMVKGHDHHDKAAHGIDPQDSFSYRQVIHLRSLDPVFPIGFIRTYSEEESKPFLALRS